VSGARSVAHRAGFEFVRYTPRNFTHLRRPVLLRELGITCAVDVGANCGDWASALREDYDGRIVSFEPAAGAYERLAAAAAQDPLWTCRRLAIGDTDGEITLHLAANEWQSSSCMPMHERHLRAEPSSRIVGSETVPLARLDSVAPDLFVPEDRLFVKMDVQGYELRVIQGAAHVLALARLVEAELSFVELYEGQALAHEVMAALYEAGFELVSLEAIFRDPASGDLLSANALFVARAAPAEAAGRAVPG